MKNQPWITQLVWIIGPLLFLMLVASAFPSVKPFLLDTLFIQGVCGTAYGGLLILGPFGLGALFGYHSPTFPKFVYSLLSTAFFSLCIGVLTGVAMVYLTQLPLWPNHFLAIKGAAGPYYLESIPIGWVLWGTVLAAVGYYISRIFR